VNGYVLDTSFVSAFFNTDDYFFKEANKIGSQLDSSLPILVPFIVFAKVSRFPNKQLRDVCLKTCLEVADVIPSLEEENLLSILTFQKGYPRVLPL
jgi:hypothetical protein